MRRAAVALLLLATAQQARSWGTTSEAGRIPDATLAPVEANVAPQGTGGRTGPQFMADLRAHAQPTPMHQFIVMKAVQLLELDPAFKDSGFPTHQQINGWDGVVIRADVSPRGPHERDSSAAPFPGGADLTSQLYPESSPGPDADYTRTGAVSAEYRGAAHYWNPWLGMGGAPTATGLHYGALVMAIEQHRGERAKAKEAAYMAHYVTDVASPKHADVLTLTGGPLDNMVRIAREFHDAANDNPDTWWKCDTMNHASGEPNEYIRRARAQFDAAVPADRRDELAVWWTRVDANMAYLQPVRDTRTTFVDLFGASTGVEMRCRAIAAYLFDLGEHHASKPPAHFYSYFDPFYYNGPVINGATLPVQFDLSVPMGQHLVWETDPAQTRFVAAKTPLAPADLGIPGLAATPEANYRRSDWKPGADFWHPSEMTRRPARAEAMAGLVRGVSEAAHGDGSADFGPAFESQVGIAIQGALTAFRASITGIRIASATWTHAELEGRVRIHAEVRNAGGAPLHLRRATVWRIAGEGADRHRENVANQPIRGDVAPGATHPVRFTIEGNPSADGPYQIDVIGDYGDTPDAGRAVATLHELRVSMGADGLAKVGGDQPVDLVVVFDTTGSMQGSIDAVRTETIQIIGDLGKRTSDLRLGLVQFRDLAADGAEDFTVSPLSADLPAQFAVMGAWVADGGGDTEEDLLYGIELALDQWDHDANPRAPGANVLKLVVCITDAPGHIPDSAGRTVESVADHAERVDPAHVYSIVVGGSSTASEHARLLAEQTDGAVLPAGDPSATASLLVDAVDAALLAYASPPPPGRPTAGRVRGAAALVLAGLAMCVSGIAMFAVGTLRR